ncbi:MAG: GGDEF domain-containing protein [Leptothrix sp. (in: b-proteobacteria)]
MIKSRTDHITASLVGLPMPGVADSGGDVVWQPCDGLDALLLNLPVHEPQAVVIAMPARAQAQALLTWAGLSQVTSGSALVVIWPAPDRDLTRRLIQAGVQEVLATDEVVCDRLQRAVWTAVERKRQELEVRRAWSIDLSTGLPNRALLVELLNQLCALREREPAPMALVVVRLDGLEALAQRLGETAAHLVKRKAAVRLRAALRSSDFVAVIGNDAFVALLTSLERVQDGERVATKLAQSMSEPYVVTGQQAMLGVSTGVSVYPDQGRHAEELLTLALSSATHGRGLRRGGMLGRPEGAANDE